MHVDQLQKRHKVKRPSTPEQTFIEPINGPSDLIEDHRLDAEPGEHSLRPARPHATNAPLITPRGSRVVTIPPAEQTSPSQDNLASASTSSTSNILNEACAHLIKVDPRMQTLIDAHPCDIFSPKGLAEECEPFKTIASGIMAQQVSGAAASSIKRKFIHLFEPPHDGQAENYFPSPQEVAARSVPFLRQAGLSERKAEYIKVRSTP